MAYYHDDGTPINPDDVPLPDLCRLCRRYLGPPDARTCGEAQQFSDETPIYEEDELHASMEEVRCTLTRIDHHFAPSPIAPFICGAFVSRFGGATVLWH